MNHLLSFLLVVVVLILLIAGIVFISSATSFHIPNEARMPSMVGGIVCLLLSCGLLVFGIFTLRRRDVPPGLPRDQDRPSREHDGIRPI